MVLVSVALKVGVSPVTGLLKASLRVMVMVDVEAPSEGVGPEPEIFEFSATAESAIKMTDPSAFDTGVAMERIFDSALVDFRVQVETPKVSVMLQAP